MQRRPPHRWLVLIPVALAAACSASGSAEIEGLFDASARRDVRGADVRSDARADARTDARVDAGRADGAVVPGMDGSATTDPDGGSVTPGEDGGVVGPGKDGGVGPGPGCGPTEMCGNGLDDDCDGRVDEDCACIPGTTQRCYPGDSSQAGRGVCVYGTSRCEGTGEFGAWGACEGAGSPQPVVCGGGMDYRCNGNVDEGCECAPGMTRACYTGPAGTDTRGACRAGTQTCTMGASGAMWGACVGEVLPGPRDLCDGVDRDCNGTANDGCTCAIGANRSCYTGPAGTMGVGICRAGAQPCVRGADGMSTTWGTCAGDVRPGPMEICNNRLDDNCNGMVDEGCPPPMTMDCPTGQPRCGGVCCAAGEACALGICVGSGQLRFTLTWDVMADLDLHVVPPCGTEIYYSRLSACGGTLDRDSCPALSATDSSDRCNGPENIFWSSAPAAGNYHVCVNPWRMNSGTANWTLNVYRGTMLIRTFTGTRSGSVGYVQCTPTAASYVGTITI